MHDLRLRLCFSQKTGNNVIAGNFVEVLKGFNMLVLTRKKTEVIVIGEGSNAITITIVEVKGDRVRIGIDAPREISIRRGELINSMPIELITIDSQPVDLIKQEPNDGCIV